MSDDFDSFFDLVKRLAAAAFRRTGEHMPLFYLLPHAEPALALLDARWTDSHDKAVKFISVRCGLDLGIFDRACLVHEMWFANYDRDKDGADVATLPPPSERADRREMLMMVCVDRDRFRIGHWEILRPHPRKNRRWASSRFRRPTN